MAHLNSNRPEVASPRQAAVPTLLKTIAAAAAIGILAGCTAPESNMPWGAPASWEGNPSIPGMSGDR